MHFEFFLLILQALSVWAKQYYITYSRSACSLDHSNCDGSKLSPFSNPIFAFKKALAEESQSFSGTVEFFFEAGSHTILPSDFLGESDEVMMKSPFKAYQGSHKN